MPKPSFWSNRMKGVWYAFKGLFLLLRTEPSIQIQFVLAIIMTVAGCYFEISATEWALQCLAIGMVMGIEGLNTAIEKVADYIQPEFDTKIGFIKDIAAGAVMLVSIIAVIVGLLIYVPKIW
ncbi:MAG: diacylglycerol kinase family protein [Croceitalea sp.]|nr:diacylglycerol kinase family protein [Croceitalea sp.]MBT8239271.1 diacylglycerol kinase family protein [Croceitalea sp.]NNL09781.1 diacylglycerol kinase family protein [Croceitalea sp.]NNM17047.1 diacylglycerol kinase family protein [Croceitalea sp.]